MLIKIPMRQLALRFPKKKSWGGRRPGAGRPRKDAANRQAAKGMPHLPRPELKGRCPVLATWRMAHGVWNLRSTRSWNRIAPAIYSSARTGFRVVHFAIMGNHVHLLVEASDQEQLARGMQGLGVRIAVRMNRMMNNRRGRVVSDRYHARILRTPTAVREARTYLLNNAFKHYGWLGPDPYTSVHPVTLPQTGLLRMHC
jgi:REP-associated tyrosine transposase